MQFIVSRLLFATLFGVTLASGCAGSTELDDDRDAALTKAIQSGMATAEIPGMLVGIWKDGSRPYVRAFGVRDKTTAQPMDTDLQMRIGSVTKTFTVMTMLQLVDENVINLDAPISEYLPSLAIKNGDRITMRMLAGMRSGLGSYTNIIFDNLPADKDKAYTPLQVAEMGIEMPTQFEPNAKFDYSNTNTILIGMAIEAKTGKKLETQIQERFAGPLKLTHTTLPIPDSLASPRSTGYTVIKGVEYDATTWNGSWGWGAGSMNSTLEEMKTWTESFVRGDRLSAATLVERNKFTDAPDEGVGVTYGLGIENDNGWLGHTGNIPGYITFAFRLPSERTTMVFMMNRSYKLQEMSAMLKEVTKIISPNNLWPDPPPQEN
ncbi:MAG: serine hydrolase domain-containing protein [Fimbriimonas sp.]